MTTDTIPQRLENLILPKLEKLPVISLYARTRGWPYVMAWIHRITGGLLALYLLFHIYTLTALRVPEAYDAQMRFFRLFIFVFLEWALAVPVILHSLNGGRLILYEIFGNRKDASLLRWTWVLSVVYVLLLGLMMMIGNQSVTPGFFWLTTMIVAASLVVVVASRVWKTAAPVGWKLQRISGGFLLLMVPAHMLFMHLNTSTGHEAAVVIARMQNAFIKFVDLALVIGAVFHGGYGLISISKDYIDSRALQKLVSLIIILVMVVFGWAGVKLTIAI